MRKKNSIINMIVGLVGQLLNMLLSFGGRMVFVHYLSQEYLGVNGLFGDVLGMLNLAELGIGSAMIFSMYRPAAQNDEKQLARLMNLYRTLYRIVALAVLGIGLALMPFLPRLMKGGEGVENLQLIYLLYLLQAVTSYLLSYKNAIYQAYQKAYIRKAIDQVVSIIRVIVQIVVLVTTRNFILYLIIQLFMPMLTSVIIWARADREFPYLKQYKELPEPQERKAIFKNVGALSLHKLATVIVRSTDNLIMSAFDGLATVGIYSNYKLVLMNVNNLLGHVTGAFTASIGNLNALEGRKRVYEIFRILDFAAQPGYKMLLVHYPEYYAEDTGALIGKNIDMALCGHAHGGQVRLPFLGALYTPDQGFLPDLTEGVQTISGTKVIISRGLGDDVGQILPRINNPPELVIIDANWY